jgi:hypothetical protein
MARAARYDGHADWYENWNRPHAERNAAEAARAAVEARDRDGP